MLYEICYCQTHSDLRDWRDDGKSEGDITIISDSGLAFTSFEKFLTEKGIRCVLNALTTRRTNGQVEMENRSFGP